MCPRARSARSCSRGSGARGSPGARARAMLSVVTLPVGEGLEQGDQVPGYPTREARLRGTGAASMAGDAPGSLGIG
jgi:hypothetical protein